MAKHSKKLRLLAALTAVASLTGGVRIPQIIQSAPIVASAATTADPRLTVDINTNDGRKASYSRNAENWLVAGGSSVSTAIGELTFTLSNGGSVGGDIRSVNCKTLQLQSGIYPYFTMDGVTIKDGDNGGVIKLEIKGLSEGKHSLKTWHSCVDNATASSVSITINGKKTASGVKCPTRVTDENNAGISYSEFEVTSGQTVTVLISPEGNGAMNNAWLNGFEIDGGDPFKGVSNIYPVDQNKHLDAETGLSWKAGTGAVSHDVYIGTDRDSVYGAEKNSPEYKGNQTGTSYKLDDSYSSIPTYYWRVDEVDANGNVVKGSVNSFNINRLSFQTAEGYGRYARGGRGGRIVEVTNLNDSGEGSLRQALEVEKGSRVVVFRVGGVINLKSMLCIPEDGGDVYVAGQTAPGDGITLTGYDFGAMGASDIVIRDVRVRVGDSNGKSTGGMGLASCNQSIIDHCSISWATDEGFSSRSAQNITFQWNIIGESLHDSVHYDAGDRNNSETHAFAASISGYTGSFHHNLLINNTGRNWSLAGAMEQDAVTYGGQLDIRNNIVYNWRDRTTDGGVRRLNFVNNYYKAGAESNTNLHVVSLDGNELGTNDMQKMYVSGNVMTDSKGGYILKSTDDAWAKGKAKSGGKNSTDSDVRSDTPFFESYVNTQSAEDAYKDVIVKAGASIPSFDYIDSRYHTEVKNGTYTYTGSKQGLKGIIDSQNDVGGYPNSSNFKSGTAPTDSDHDGMPDDWEKEHGLNPNDASDGSIVSLSADDYTNVEMYLNELAGDPVEFNGGKVGAVFDTSYEYSIVNVGSGLPLEVKDGTAANGTDVQQGNSGAGIWTLEDAGNGYYRVYSELGDGKTYLLDLDYGKTDNGTNIGIWGDTASDAQLFKFVDNGDGTYTITTKATDDKSCLGVMSDSTEDGASVIQWECNGKDSQKWLIQVTVRGKLIKSLRVKDSTYNSGWAIDTSLDRGDTVFGDRTAAFSEISNNLLKGELVLTPCDSKAAAKDVAEITAAQDITLYIGFDSRISAVPSWATSWTKETATVMADNGVTFELYSKKVSKGETVTLGANGQSSGVVNYIVIAAASSGVILGDVNCDDIVNIFDLVVYRKYIVGTAKLEGAAFDNGDLDGDGECSVADMLLLQQFLLGKIKNI